MVENATSQVQYTTALDGGLTWRTVLGTAEKGMQAVWREERECSADLVRFDLIVLWSTTPYPSSGHFMLSVRSANFKGEMVRNSRGEPLA